MKSFYIISKFCYADIFRSEANCFTSAGVLHMPSMVFFSHWSRDTVKSETISTDSIL